MWRFGRSAVERTVDCIACGETVARSAAREYDKLGDRWDRTEKDFEYLCKPCHREQCHQPRRGLEDLLETAGAGDAADGEFLAAFAAAVDEREGRRGRSGG